MTAKTRWTCAALLLALLALPAVPALAADGFGTGALDLWTTFSAWWQGLTSRVAAAETVDEPEAAGDGVEDPFPGTVTQSQEENDEGPKMDPWG